MAENFSLHIKLNTSESPACFMHLVLSAVKHEEPGAEGRAFD